MTVLDPSPRKVRVVQSPILIAVSAVCVVIVISVTLVLIYRRRSGTRFVRLSKQGVANGVLHFWLSLKWIFFFTHILYQTYFQIYITLKIMLIKYGISSVSQI